MTSRIAPSAHIEAQIQELLAEDLADPDRLAELGRLGARLVLQRAVEDEVTAFLGRARYERTAAATGSRNGVRTRRIQTAEGSLEIGMPQLRGVARRFVSEVIPDTRTIVRTRPLEALVIGSYVRGLSDRNRCGFASSTSGLAARSGPSDVQIAKAGSRIVRHFPRRERGVTVGAAAALAGPPPDDPRSCGGVCVNR